MIKLFQQTNKYYRDSIFFHMYNNTMTQPRGKKFADIIDEYNYISCVFMTKLRKK